MDITTELVRLYPWLTRMARKYYKNRMDAEDLVEDTICKALTSQHRIDRNKDLKPLLCTIMHNTYITSYNRRQLIQFCGEDTTNYLCAYCDALDQLSMIEKLHIIRRCCKRSVGVKCAVMYAKGYSYKEIGTEMGLPVNTVRSRISYARLLLRKALS